MGMSEHGAMALKRVPTPQVLSIFLLAHSVKPIPLGFPLNVPLTTTCMMFPYYSGTLPQLILGDGRVGTWCNSALNLGDRLKTVVFFLLAHLVI